MACEQCGMLNFVNPAMFPERNKKLFVLGG